MDIIVCENVTKIYGYKTAKEHVALKDVNLKIAKGSFVLLMGPSGSGKSTLLSLIASLLRPTQGRVIVDGEVVSKLPDRFSADFRRQKIGFIFQKFNLLEDLSVQENVLVPLIVSDESIKVIEEKAKRAMQRFAIDHKALMPVRKLSGGEQQRCAIARALVNDPPIILADEPTANLDDALARQLIATLDELKKEGKTIVVATHDPRFLDLDVDALYEVKEGNVYSA